ncbi:MAG: glycosyltransferase [Candidatus Methylomirabilales bacterium]
MEGTGPRKSRVTPYRTVLVVSNHGKIVGGGEVSLLTLLGGLDRSRWAPVLAVPSEGAVAASARSLGLPTYLTPLPSIRWLGPAGVRSVWTLRRLARETRAVLLHANGSRAMFYAGLAGWLVGRPVVWHVRVADRDPLLDRLLVRLAHAVIVNSTAVARRFAWAPQRKIRCVPNGVDLSRFGPRNPSARLRASLGLPAVAPVVASVGRFVAYKGYGQLLEGARLIQMTMPGVHWLLVGDGELRGELEEQCRSLGVEGHVHFTGWREDIPDILALCDLFVLPSLGEHFGRVLIEAMAMARPVVATDAGGVPEIVNDGHTGILVQPGDPSGLASAILWLLEHPKRSKEMGAAGRKRVIEHFSIETHVRGVENVYDTLCTFL